MSFIGESRKTFQSPWKHYVCLNEEDCKELLPLVVRAKEKAKKKFYYYEDILQSGEASTKQQNSLVKWESKVEQLEIVEEDIKEYLNTRRNGNDRLNG